jgi:hypothetical protein
MTLCQTQRVDAGLAAVIGALIGAVATLVGLSVQRRGEDRHRFADMKRASYGAYLDAADAIHSLAETNHETGRMRELLRDIEGAHQRMLLLAPPEVVAAARTLRSTTNHLADASPPSYLRAGTWERIEAGWSVSREAFSDAARSDLDVAGRPGRRKRD